MGKSVQDVSPSGDTQTGDASLQTDQSVQKPEELFGVGDIEKLPEALRPTYQNWQKEYTQTRQREKAELDQLRTERDQLQQDNVLHSQKAADYDALYNDPAFQDFALGQVNQVRGQQQPQRQQGGFNYDEYENPDGMKAYKDDIVASVEGVMQRMLQPILGNVAANSKRAEFDTLVATAKQNNWPDPNGFSREMDVIGKKYPNMSLNEAYDMAKGMRDRSLVTRPPVNPNVNNQAAPTQDVVTDSPIVKPGGTSVNPNPLVGMSAFEQALDDSNNPDSVSKPGVIKKLTDLPRIIREIASEQGVDARDL